MTPDRVCMIGRLAIGAATRRGEPPEAMRALIARAGILRGRATYLARRRTKAHRLVRDARRILNRIEYATEPNRCLVALDTGFRYYGGRGVLEEVGIATYYNGVADVRNITIDPDGLHRIDPSLPFPDGGRHKHFVPRVLEVGTQLVVSRSAALAAARGAVEKASRVLVYSGYQDCDFLGLNRHHSRFTDLHQMHWPWSGRRQLSLTGFCAELGIPTGDAHLSGNDALYTLKLGLRLLEEKNRLLDLDAAWQLVLAEEHPGRYDKIMVPARVQLGEVRQ